MNEPLSPPPEGAIAGENIPRENEEYSETVIEEAKNALKTQHRMYRKMSSDELEERAVKLLRKNGVSL